MQPVRPPTMSCMLMWLVFSLSVNQQLTRDEGVCSVSNANALLHARLGACVFVCSLNTPYLPAYPPCVLWPACPRHPTPLCFLCLPRHGFFCSSSTSLLTVKPCSRGLICIVVCLRVVFRYCLFQGGMVKLKLIFMSLRLFE